MRAITSSLLGLSLFACGDPPAPTPMEPAEVEASVPEASLEAPDASDGGASPSAPRPFPFPFPLPLDAGMYREPLGPDPAAPFADAGAFGAVLPLSTLPGDVDDPKYKALEAELTRKRALDAAGLRAAYPAPLTSGVSYDARTAQFMDRIQASALALNPTELEKLVLNGLVISQRREFSTFVRGFAEIYAEHLPLFVSADALLDAVHRAYDAILMNAELSFLRSDLTMLLGALRERLANVTGYKPEVLADVDLYLCVATGLLMDNVPMPVRGADPKLVADLLAKAVSAAGPGTFPFFGVPRLEDFSQFKPRGHYESNPRLQTYFRAQMWLGRVDFRLIEVEGGAAMFRRPQYEGMLLLQELIGADNPYLDRLDGVIRTFVGASDSLNPAGAGRLIRDLGGSAAAKSASDDAVVQAIREGGYGTQQIASHLTFVADDGMPDPLSRSYLILGQRYVVDSHVFSNVVYDRIPERRMMPDPLDAAFAVLGNTQALSLSPDLGRWPSLPGALGAMRTLVDAHDATFWNQSFYNQWLRALRALSPAADSAAAAALPEIARSEAWGRRILNTQLGSWAQLRHDTLLYAKQSYTGIPVCEYPDVYVDPYPELYRALHDYALAGARLAERLPFQALRGEPAAVPRYFAALERATRVLGDMAERELRGEPFSADQMAFINDAVRIERESAGCASIDVPDGWLADLFLDPRESIEEDLPIADVHTQPADESGSLVGRILHVGTGYPRFMVTSIDTCMGPRAYAGVVFAYHEHITERFERYSDSRWAEHFHGAPEGRPAELPWLVPILAR